MGYLIHQILPLVHGEASIASVMSFPPDLDTTLAELWRRNVAGAEAAGCNADPEAFAAALADKNFT